MAESRAEDSIRGIATAYAFKSPECPPFAEDTKDAPPARFYEVCGGVPSKTTAKITRQRNRDGAVGDRSARPGLDYADREARQATFAGACGASETCFQLTLVETSCGCDAVPISFVESTKEVGDPRHDLRESHPSKTATDGTA